MIYFITIGAFIAATLFVLAAYSLLSSQTQQVVAERLARIRTHGLGRMASLSESESLAPELDPIDHLVSRIILPLGRLFGQAKSANSGGLRRKLTMAGYFSDNAALIYTGIRILLAVALPVIAVIILAQLHAPVLRLMFLLPVLALFGFVMPSVVLSSRVTRRQLAIRNGLADALDLMVSCVEAGLSLNAALARVALELRLVHPDLAREFEITGLEMRTGKPREDALRNLGQRSGVKDLKSFTAMLIQTDKFGTSIARALRVFSDTLRTKRRQRAEEAAAQTTIKLVFPLVFFIFPAILLVLLGPGIIQVMEVMRPAMGR
jgi:tight adherence protein C